MSLSRVLLITLVSIVPVLAQDPANPPQAAESKQELVSVKDLTLTYYEPKNLSAAELANAASRLYHRTIYVANADGPPSKIANISEVGRAVLVYDIAANAKAILTGLETMDEANAPAKSPAIELVSSEYEPRYLGASDIQAILSQHRREVIESSEKGARAFSNFTILPERGLVIFRDTKENVERMTRAIVDRDRPSAQVTVSFMLIQGSASAAESTLPAELTKNLAMLTGYKSFAPMATGVVRSGGRSDRPVELEMKVDDETDCRIRFSPAGWNGATNTMSFTGLDVMLVKTPAATNGVATKSTRQQLTTSTSVSADEYTVIGAFGAQPVFVVVRVTPIR